MTEHLVSLFGLVVVALVGFVIFQRILRTALEHAQQDQAETRKQCREVMEHLQARSLTEYRLKAETVPLPGPPDREQVDEDWEEPSFRRPQERVPLGLGEGDEA